MQSRARHAGKALFRLASVQFWAYRGQSGGYVFGGISTLEMEMENGGTQRRGTWDKSVPGEWIMEVD